MKQCPQCLESYHDDESFCDLDGSQLVDNIDSIRDALVTGPETHRNASGLVTGIIGALAGAIICLLLYIVFLLPYSGQNSGREGRDNQNRGTNTGISNQVALSPVRATSSPIANETPSPGATPSESLSPPVPTPVTPSPEPTASAVLNNGPIATGTGHPRENERAVILLKDGSSVEADAAWQDNQGVWFRRSGVVSFLERSRVEKITEPVQPKTAATAATEPK
jgi:hypothetical protein